MFQVVRLCRSPVESWERFVARYIRLRMRRAAALVGMRRIRRERARRVPKDSYQRKVEAALLQKTPWQPIGCTCVELRAHFEMYFTGNLGWHNEADWHIDYLMPRCAFAPKDRMLAFHYTNLRPKRGPFGPIYMVPPLGDDPRQQERGVPSAVPNGVQAKAKRSAARETARLAKKIRAAM